MWPSIMSLSNMDMWAMLMKTSLKQLGWIGILSLKIYKTPRHAFRYI